MYWSVFGLYAAFVAEMAVRLPLRTAFSSLRTFFIIVGVSTFATMLVGQILFFRNKKKWQAIFTPLVEKDEPSLQLEESI